MQEFVSDAVILRKQPLRDVDGRYSFFTERYGKVVGKATSSRKITSKLSAHLEPGNVSRVRYVEKGGVQIVDALKSRRIALNPHDLELLSGLLPEGLPEPLLWGLLAHEEFSWPAALVILGWDPREAHCARCRAREVSTFHPDRQEFFCAVCATKLNKNEVIFLYVAEVQPQPDLGE